jgi:pilus assembly protein Flp/PilA
LSGCAEPAPALERARRASARQFAENLAMRRRSARLIPRRIAGRSIIARLIAASAGVTAVEYGLLVGLIAVVIIATLSSLGSNISTVFSRITLDL